MAGRAKIEPTGGKRVLQMTPPADRAVHQAAYTDTQPLSTTCGLGGSRSGFGLREGRWTGPGASKPGAPPDSAPRYHEHASKEPNDPADNGRREAKLDDGKGSSRCMDDEPNCGRSPEPAIGDQQNSRSDLIR